MTRDRTPGANDDTPSSEVRPNNDSDNKFVRQTHRYSAVAKMNFIVDAKAVADLGYTGQYATGNDAIIARVSARCRPASPDGSHQPSP